jgi:hypothetical protein
MLKLSHTRPGAIHEDEKDIIVGKRMLKIKYISVLSSVNIQLLYDYLFLL